MVDKAANIKKSSPRRTRVLYACILGAALLAASWAAQDLREASAQAGVCVSPPTGMVGWWPGDGNANNLLVGGNNGTLEGGVTFTSGLVGQAFNLNGTSADVKISASPGLNVGSGNGFTIDAWVNPATVTPGRPPGMPLVEWNNGAGNVGAHFWISIGGSGNLFANIYDTSGAPHVISSSSNLIGAGTFQHVALTYDKTTGVGTLYRNGSIVAQQNLGIFTPQTSYNLYLGLRPSGDGAGARYNGRLDEVGLFSRALSQAEIRAIHQAGAVGKCKTVFTVRNTKDDGDGSLRQAILDSNSIAGTQTIAFNIPGAGVRTIAPLTQLPDITDTVVIDGYTQPGASPNTLAVGNDARLLVELDGTNAGSNSNGLVLRGGGSTVKGLVINRFDDRGISIQPNGGNFIEGCFVGTDATGTVDLGNRVGGVFVFVSSNNTIGGTTPAARNVVSGNGVNGVDIRNEQGSAATGNQIIGNYIGTGATGTKAIGNVVNGVQISQSNNTVGGTALGAGNVIANNGDNGVSVVGANSGGNAVFGNSIYGNAGLGIDLGDDGVTPNDDAALLDADGGPNRRQNFPELINAVVNSGVTFSAFLRSTANTNFRVEFFSGTSCAPSGRSEARTFLDFANVTTNAGGFANISAASQAKVKAGEFYTATATNLSTGDTSEFAQCIQVSAADRVTVMNLNDEGPGSLRQGIEDIFSGGSIDFAPGVAGVVNLTRELVIDRTVTINGPATGLLTLSGGGAHRVLHVVPGGVADVSRLRFSSGRNDDVGGGAILNDGNLTLTNCAVSDSRTARSGGGILSRGALNMKDSALDGNVADEGGGLYNSGRANVSASTFSRNSSRLGGGIVNAVVLTLTNCTVALNASTQRGAGVDVQGAGPTDIVASTIAGNILSGQSARGGGVSNIAPASALSLRNSIVADNVFPNGADDISGAVTSLDFNLIGSIAGAAITGSTGHNVTGVAPRLGPLKNNGGPTDTRSLLADSPALDVGDDALGLAGATDQRGRPRKVDGNSDGKVAVDIGAFESGAAVRGFVADEDDRMTPLGSVTFKLRRDPVTRSATSEDRADPAGGVNLILTDVPEGTGYELTSEPTARFAYSFAPVCLDVSAAGVVTECGKPDVITRLTLVGKKQLNAFATIKGRVTNGAGEGIGGVTLTLSGPKTVVQTLPECTAQDADACGRYEFRDVPTNLDYTLTPSKPGPGFTAEGPLCDGLTTLPCNNTRGGADIESLGADDVFEVVVNFDGDGGPTPPPPSDDFTAASIDPDRFKTGALSLAAESLSAAVFVEQGNGQLQITTPASGAPPTQGANVSAAAAQEEKFNGYVSVRDIDLNTSTSVSVKADEPIFDGGAQTVFSFGSDSENFFRIRVGGPSSTLGEPASQATTATAADTPTIFFETFSDGKKSPQSPSAAFKSDEYVYWRLRFEPRTPALDALCTDTSAQTFVLFETSVDRSVWRTHHCAPVGAGRSHVAAELLAGVAGNTKRDPDTAKFSDYRVAGVSSMGFAPPATSEVERGTQSIELRLVRGGSALGGDVSSAASVVLRVAGVAGEATQPCAGAVAPPCKVFFGPGQTTTTFSFRNPTPDAADGSEISLALDAAAGGALDSSSSALKLRVVDHGFRGNRIGESDFFAAQHYCDFLGRPPDGVGLRFWTNEIESCGTGTEAAQCREIRRINVSAAFFLSIEFKETGYFVHKLYETSFGRMPQRTEFLDGAGAVGKGVVVGLGGWQDTLNKNKSDFVKDWVQRTDFRERFDSLKSAEFVDALYANAGVRPDDNVRTHLILELTTGGMTRAQVLRAAAEDGDISAAHFNRAFVLMQYFGYMRRDPDAVGYYFWLQKLEDFGGDFVRAEMVKAFLSSDEYRQRFKDKPTPSCGP